MCELARNSILQSGWELKIKKLWLGTPPLELAEPGDDLETVSQTNVPPGRLAFRRETLAEEKRLMMLSTRRSRANTADSWASSSSDSRPVSRNVLLNGIGKGTPAGVLGMEKEALEDVEERSDESEHGSS